MNKNDVTSGKGTERLVKIALQVSPLLFLWKPFMGGLAPAIIWYMYREKIPGIDQAGRKTMKFQVIWLVVLMCFLGIGLVIKNFHLPAPQLMQYSNSIIIGLYLANILFILYKLTLTLIRR